MPLFLHSSSVSTSLSAVQAVQQHPQLPLLDRHVQPKTITRPLAWPQNHAAAHLYQPQRCGICRSVKHTPAKIVAKAASSLSSPASFEQVEERELHTEASESYLAYAMSVIVGRAIPDVRDGLKPVHRRILYAMHELGLSASKPYRKCARVVGEVLGKYHPHGDSSVYDALVRMAQDFSMRETLVSGHGNFGSLDDDPAAAMRYTECRLSSLSQDMLLADLEQDTVPWAPTFDGAQDEPLVLPARLPHLLINGANGIAVGIATRIPPHNLSEIVSGLCALIENPDITTRELMQHVLAPDFPTGGEVVGGPGLLEAYETGSGSVLLRARVSLEEEGGKKRGSKKLHTGSSESGKTLIVITEIPYQTSKAELVERIAELVESKVVEGVSDVRDESDRQGLRVVVEVRRGFSAEVVLNQLHKHTRLTTRFSFNCIALVGSTPQQLGLKQMLQHFIDFRCEVVERRGRWELSRAQQRLHLVEGFLCALQQLESVVQIIRAAADSSSARTQLSASLGLSEEQSEAVLGLTLRRLTGLEADKLCLEQSELNVRIRDLTALLAERSRILSVVQQEARALAAKYGSPRRTQVLHDSQVAELQPEDVIPNRRSLLVYSRKGFVKRLEADAFESQRRGGKGKQSARLRDADSLGQMLPVMDHDELLCLTAAGRAYGLRAYQVPAGSTQAAGSPLSAVLGSPAPLACASMLPLTHSGREQLGDDTLVLLSVNGIVKRMLLPGVKKLTRAGLQVMRVGEGDSLGWAAAVREDGCALLVASSSGRLLLFPVSHLRVSGRTSAGVKAMRLRPGEQVVSLCVLPPALVQQLRDVDLSVLAEAPPEESESEADALDMEAAELVDTEDAAGTESGVEDELDGLQAAESSSGASLLLVTARGLGNRPDALDAGKRIRLSHLTLGRRAQSGIQALSLQPGNRLLAAMPVYQGQEVLLGSRAGMATRISADEVPLQQRRARGVLVMNVDAEDEVQSASVLPSQLATVQ